MPKRHSSRLKFYDTLSAVIYFTDYKENVMNKIVSAISVLLVALMLFSMLVGCITPEVPEGSSPEASEGTPEETPVETEPPADPIDIILSGKCRYTVIRPELTSDTVKQAAVALKTALSEATGENVKISEDVLYGGAQPEQYEILVGQTNREESARAVAGSKYDDSFFVIDGDKLVINSYNDDKVAEAVEYFIEKIKASNGDLTITDEDQRVSRATYALADITIGGESINGYTLVYKSSASALIKTAVEQFRDEIIAISGIYLPITSDSKNTTDKEILVGNTKRSDIDTDALGDYGYAIKVNGDKIMLAANDSNYTLLKTIEKALDMAQTGKIEEKQGKLEMSEKPLFTAMCFSDVHNNFAMLEPNNRNYKDYVVRKNVDRIIDLILETEGPVDMVLVGGDYMSDYPYWNSSGFLPYEYYLGFKEKTIKTFERLTKDGKVMYVAGNHDYAQGEASTDGPGTNGSYNSFDFYFTGPMNETLGVLAEEDMIWKIGEHTGEKYLLGYHYEIDGIHFIGFSPDPDIIWSSQEYGFNEAQLEWLGNKLDEIDPYGTELIFVNCHYAMDQRLSHKDINYLNADNNVANDLKPLLMGHRNLFYMFGHWHIFESFHTDYTVKNVFHYNNSGKAVNIKGTETESTEITSLENRSFNAVWMGAFRLDWSDNREKFEDDFVIGRFVHQSTGTPMMAQGMYIEIFEDRVVFTMKNIGTWEGFSTEDILASYTVYLYK